MFKKGQLVKSPGGNIFGRVLWHSTINDEHVRVEVINGPARGVIGLVYAHTLELIGNNYQAKQKCSR